MWMSQDSLHGKNKALAYSYLEKQTLDRLGFICLSLNILLNLWPHPIIMEVNRMDDG